MHMTRLDLQRGSRTAAELFGDVQRMHTEICRLAGSARLEANILYRLAGYAVYVSSDCPLDISRASKGVSIGVERDLGEWANELKPGQYLRFDLLAVPSCKKDREGYKNSQRVLIADPAGRLDWLQRQAAKHGFEIIEVEERGSSSVSGYQRKRGKHFVMRGYQYTGILRITDAEKFRNALRTGIGPQKAYGYGMLMVVPL